MRLLHLADLHLGAACSAFGALAPQRRAAILEAFRSLPDRAVQHRVDAVLIAGDLFDGPAPDTELLAAARDVLRRLVDACVPVFLVPGNHDAVTLRMNPYRELARAGRVVVQGQPTDRRWPVEDEEGRRLAEKHAVYILARPAFDGPVTVETADGPLHVYGLAYDGAECPDPLATFRRADEPGVHVVLLHASVHDVPHWRGSGNTLLTTLEALERLDVDYIALGDYHRHRPPGTFGNAPACYPGSFAALDLAEHGARGFVVVDLAPGRPPVVEHVDAGVRPVVSVELDVTGCIDDVAVAEAAARALSPDAIPVLSLTGEPAFPLDADAIATELRQRHGHAHVVDETRYYAAARLDELAERDTVVGHVVRLGRSRIAAAADEEEREVAQRALRVALRAMGAE